MACPWTKNKLVGTKFPVHGVVNHVLLRQRGLGLAKLKLTLSIGVFYSHTLKWLPRVIERIGLNMRLNHQVFWGCQKRGIFLHKRSGPKRGVVQVRASSKRRTKKLSKNLPISNRKNLGCEQYLSWKLTIFLKAWNKRVAKRVDFPWQGWHVIMYMKM